MSKTSLIANLLNRDIGETATFCQSIQRKCEIKGITYDDIYRCLIENPTPSGLTEDMVVEQLNSHAGVESTVIASDSTASNNALIDRAIELILGEVQKAYGLNPPSLRVIAYYILKMHSERLLQDDITPRAIAKYIRKAHQASVATSVSRRSGDPTNSKRQPTAKDTSTLAEKSSTASKSSRKVTTTPHPKKKPSTKKRRHWRSRNGELRQNWWEVSTPMGGQPGYRMR